LQIHAVQQGRPAKTNTDLLHTDQSHINTSSPEGNILQKLPGDLVDSLTKPF
jgi:hypothetical protein